MIDFDERVVPGSSSNFMYMEALSRYVFALKYTQKNFKVLDLGCGTGYGSACLAQESMFVLGIDINTEAIKYAKTHYIKKNLKFRKSNLFDIGALKGKYDLICLFEVIEHLKDPKKVLEIIKDLLKPKGILIISTPNIKFSSPDGIIGSSYHLTEYDLGAIKKLLQSEYKNVEIFGQVKTNNAIAAWKDFMESQTKRQTIVDKDKFGIRKLIPRNVKEQIWRIFGNFVGRKTQEYVDINDFPINLDSTKVAHYFIALCQK